MSPSITHRFIRAQATLVCLLCVALCSCGAELPQGSSGPEAERLASKMLEAVSADSFWLAEGARWRFMSHSYLWHRGTGRVRVRLAEDETTYLELKTGRAFALRGGEQLTGGELEEARAEAIKAFNNDSFWAFAPFKVLDTGAQRRLVRGAEGDELLVTYTTGGSTPGDSYLWRLDERGRPVSWRMWVSVIPRRGVKTSWEGWAQTRSGAWVATEHRALGLTLKVKELALTRRFVELEDLDPLLIDGW